MLDGDQSPEPAISFFEEGFEAENPDPHANALHVDPMAHLDTPIQASGFADIFNFDASGPHDDTYAFDFVSSLDNTDVDFSHQPAATSSGLQPCIGASS